MWSNLWLKLRANPLLALALVVGSGLVLAGAGSATALHLEEQDSFCVACHTVPEIVYYNRAQAAIVGEWPFADLSSAHYAAQVAAQAEPFRCIACHRGDDSLPHRALTLALGARDAMIHFSGQGDPTPEKGRDHVIVPHLLNAACEQCHADALLAVGIENHFHSYLPTAYALWREGAALVALPGVPDAVVEAGLPEFDTSVTCIDCHSGHVAAPVADGYLQVTAVLYPSCERCHIEVELGPLGLADQP